MLHLSLDFVSQPAENFHHLLVTVGNHVLGMPLYAEDVVFLGTPSFGNSVVGLSVEIKRPIHLLDRGTALLCPQLLLYLQGSSHLLVARVDDCTFDLYDIKTWATPTNDNLMKARYQLSIYAFYLTLNNPNAKVRNLAIIHLRETEKDHIAEIIPVSRIPSDICEELLQTYLDGKPFNNPYDVPLDIRGQESLIRSLMETKARAEEQLNQIKAGIMKRMELLDIRSWSTDTMKITRKLASTRSNFDLSTFRLAYPDLNYDDYMRTSRVSPSLVITV